MISRLKVRKARPTVVSSVQTQTQQAAELAAIEGQTLLVDPRTNPNVRGHADLLRDAQHRRVLDAEHARVLRRHRVADRRAADAERTLELIQDARQATAPARSVMALHVGRRRFMTMALAASLALSVGSATGMAKLATTYGASSLAGWVAEVGLTGLATSAILYRSHIAAHGGRFTEKSWQNRVLWALTILPLVASVIANFASNGMVGVACSLGAAAFSLLSAVISDTSSAALHDQAARVSQQDITHLHAVALGEDTTDLIPVPAMQAPVEVEDAPAIEAAVEIGEVGPGEGTGSASLVELAARKLGVSVQDLEQVGDDVDWPKDLDLDGPDPAWVRGVVDQGQAELDAWLADQDEDQDDGVPPAHGPAGGQVTILPGGRTDADQGEPSDNGDATKALQGFLRSQLNPGTDPAEAARTWMATRARREQGEATRAKVAAFQAENPDAKVTEIAEALGISERTVREARSALKGGGRS